MPAFFNDTCQILEKTHTLVPQRRAGFFELILANIRTSPVGIYLLKVNDRNTRTRCEICSKLTIKTPLRQLYCLL